MKKILIAILVLISMVSCTKSFKINVNLENSTDKTVYLQKYVDGTFKNVDSVVAKDNLAVFSIQQSVVCEPYNIMMKGWKRPLVVFADNQDVTISGDCQKYSEIKVKASATQELLNIFNAEMNLLKTEEEMYYAAMGFVKENSNNIVSPFVLYRYKGFFKLDELERLYETFPETVQGTYKDLVLKYIEKVRTTEPGQPYIDFTMKDLNGNDLALSTVVGNSKFVILDFWASWCPDCRANNPELVKVYNMYKDKGLDVFSVSLDENETAWKEAIEKDGLTWTNHVSDLKRWNNEAADLYGVAFIPQTFLIDDNGIILEKNLPDDKLEEVLSSRLK